MTARRDEKRGSPTQEDIELDEVGFLSDDNHEDIAYEAGYLTEDEYQTATGMPDWWLAGGDET